MTDEIKKVLEALKTIQQYCISRKGECFTCCFCKNDDCGAMYDCKAPEEWILEPKERDPIIEL